MTNDRHISPEDLSLYAMQALSKEESAAVRLHLPECSQCREELAEIFSDLSFVPSVSNKNHCRKGRDSAS